MLVYVRGLRHISVGFVVDTMMPRVYSRQVVQVSVVLHGQRHISVVLLSNVKTVLACFQQMVPVHCRQMAVHLHHIPAAFPANAKVVPACFRQSEAGVAVFRIRRGSIGSLNRYVREISEEERYYLSDEHLRRIIITPAASHLRSLCDHPPPIFCLEFCQPPLTNAQLHFIPHCRSEIHLVQRIPPTQLLEYSQVLKR